MAELRDRSDAIHDALADSYGYDVTGQFSARLKNELVARAVQPADRLLDVGCANGIHLRLHAPRCRVAVGVDINERMLELARAKLAGESITTARLVRASASELPFDDDEFDLAYSFSTLLLVPNSDAAIREIARVVRPGGTTVLDLTGRLNLSQRHWRRWYRDQGHFGLNAYRLSQALRLHHQYGLDPVEVHGLGLTDQWKYVRFASRFTRLETVFHGPRPGPDLDYRLSNIPGLRALANRWYVVARKQSTSG